MNRAAVYFRDRLAGELKKLATGDYRYLYCPNYLAQPNAKPVSLTLPLQSKPFRSDHLFPFFYGLLAEGSAKDLQCHSLKIDSNDAFTRLLKTGHSDTIGAVTVRELLEEAPAKS
jgi:HipA-like protein